ncbi:group 4 capsule polysaccharide lipoprotein GfcB/YjbF [Vibrio crassostreae]|uniref:YjbF family lipoprotein n=1 Tax=Vibrio crassostreae TaxID=246167 RepID=UPI000F486848|nr:YjbF family lipoprotein [Vibrio crassostreae]NOH75334.1 YjbF family lipoprotein [Vibrio crassostreae]NOI52918.1 YjbF family lipoprotein [Vibrio crassostreae]ROR09671.1 group 4 capsule polysaccharide lipoprotein GfcB/YjbF [Vibrio crassostreae]TCN76752.1 group 4 capsule polysaccharide lipoprotein GfcB/YjbF [Vibrio crassostreae]TWD36558.1 group 4 capsule polysaccharide lipoprotein GfcB/YjbF [Vibrio crassostreae]
MLKPLIISLGLFLAGCSQQFQDVNSTFDEAFFGSSDVELSKEYIQTLPYSSIYAEVNEQGKIFMVLAYVGENPQTGAEQLKWMSSDKAMIVTENGRIVQTLLLPYENLSGLAFQPLDEYSSANNSSPHYSSAFDVSANPGAQKWQAVYDWQPNYRFGYKANITRTYAGNQTVETPLASIDTKKFQEKINFPMLEQEMTNEYWVDSKGKVVKTIQYLGPDMTRLELTVLKHYQSN